ncbi:site-specific integrase [Photobacterium sp. ZSDE20]|uniref:Site-specific integrase n=1 Tax=Photobacterium pectinilyticum TaxID=2906793 RepID=A0ABT1N8J2_9GAMM|nr:site-specific integrase [Photobacterium sp. ZSDE20]MCQ1061080.1 site-specific integrase [Photobacterium sp. ZSDE20]MDD1826201.1 site-specific integrase [Photobacterium sp. ZSDE20]
MTIIENELKKIIKLDRYDGPAELSDGKGLIARISHTASVTFMYRCRFEGRSLRVKIGTYPTTSLKQARRTHEIMRQLRRSGEHPRYAINAKPRKVTLKCCVQYWLTHYVPNLKPGTQVHYRSFARTYFTNVFNDRDIEKIHAREWMSWFDSISAKKPKTARSVFTIIRSCLNFCKSKFFIERTDLERIKKQHVGVGSSVGSRVLTMRELSIIWQAIDDSHASASNKALHQLTILFGNRVSEMRLARRSHFNLEDGIWTVPAEISKTNRTIRRPIPSKARSILLQLMRENDEILFPGHNTDTPITISAANRYIRSIRNRLPIDDWRTHDFRRSLSTESAKFGTLPHIIEKMLGHELGGVFTIYNKHDWLDEQLAAYERYSQNLFELLCN